MENGKIYEMKKPEIKGEGRDVMNPTVKEGQNVSFGDYEMAKKTKLICIKSPTITKTYHRHLGFPNWRVS